MMPGRTESLSGFFYTPVLFVTQTSKEMKFTEHELPNDIKWKQICHETIFWAIQQRRPFDDKEAVYFGIKPVPPENLTSVSFCYVSHTSVFREEQKREYIQTKRSDNIWARVELLKQRIGEQTENMKQMYKDGQYDILCANWFESSFAEVRNQFFNDLNAADEEEEWQMVRGRGLVRVPRRKHITLEIFVVLWNFRLNQPLLLPDPFPSVPKQLNKLQHELWADSLQYSDRWNLLWNECKTLILPKSSSIYFEIFCVIYIFRTLFR